MAISGNPPRSLLANHLQSHSSPRFSLQASQAFFEAQARSSRCCPCQAGKTPCSKKVKAIAGRCAFAFLDEAEFHLNPQLTRMWMLRGEQVKVPSAGQNRRVCTFGALDWTTEGLSVMATEKKRSVEFLEFIKWLVDSVYVDYEHVYLFLDNCAIHKTKAVGSHNKEKRKQYRLMLHNLLQAA